MTEPFSPGLLLAIVGSVCLSLVIVVVSVAIVVAVVRTMRRPNLPTYVDHDRPIGPGVRLLREENQ